MQVPKIVLTEGEINYTYLYSSLKFFWNKLHILVLQFDLKLIAPEYIIIFRCIELGFGATIHRTQSDKMKSRNFKKFKSTMHIKQLGATQTFEVASCNKDSTCKKMFNLDGVGKGRVEVILEHWSLKLENWNTWDLLNCSFVNKWALQE